MKEHRDDQAGSGAKHGGAQEPPSILDLILSITADPSDDQSASKVEALKAIARKLRDVGAANADSVERPRDRMLARLAEARKQYGGAGQGSQISPDETADGFAKNAETVTLDLAVSAIGGGHVENIRLFEDETAFTALRDSLHVQGQLQSIVVVPDQLVQGRYQLVAGNRRYRAACLLGWRTVRATILPAGTDEEKLLLVNAAENAQRSRISDFEITSRGQLMARRFKTPLAKYARAIGYSESRVQNLVRYLEGLPSDILADWRNGDPLLKDHLLQKLVEMPHDEASQFWLDWKRRFAVAKTSKDAGREGALRRRSVDRPTGTMLARLHVAIQRNSDMDDKTRRLVLSVVEFCAGNASGIPGIFEPGPRRVRSRKQDGGEPRQEAELEFPDRGDGMSRVG